MEEHARELEFLEWPEKPIHRINIGGQRKDTYVVAVEMHSPRNFEPPSVAPATPQLQPPFAAWPGVFRSWRLRRRIVGFGIRGQAQNTGLKNTCLRDQSGAVAELRPLLEAYLGLPQPRISGTC